MTVSAKQKMSIFAEMECHFSAVSIAVYTALIHHFTCRLEARQALIYQLVSGLTGENGKYNYSRAVHLYPPFFDITCSAKNYKIAPALTNDSQAAYIQKPTKNNREGAYLFMLGVDTGKSLLLQRLLLDEEGPGYCHFPKDEGRGYDEDYFIGLTAEKQILTYKRGRPLYEWKIKDYKHKRNEALDCRNYAAAAIEIAQVPLKKKEEQPQAKKKRRKRRTNGGVI